MSIKIIADNACDLSKEKTQKLDIEIINISLISNGGEEIKDIGPEEVFKRQEEGEVFKTSQISQFSYYVAFEKYIKEKRPFIYLSLSQGLTGGYNNSLIALKELRKKYGDFKGESIDTEAASVGMGIFTYLVGKTAKEDYSFEELLELSEFLRENIGHVFTVFDLKYLYEGGRILRVGKNLSDMLNLMPIIKVKDKKLKVSEIIRGRNKAIKRMANIIIKESEGSLKDKIIMPVYGKDEDTIETFMGLLKNGGCENILSHQMGYVIGSHVGPDIIGAGYLKKSLPQKFAKILKWHAEGVFFANRLFLRRIMKKYIMAFDAGTTSARTILFNLKGEIVSSASKNILQFFPHPGWVEEDPSEIWSAQISTAVEAMSKISASTDEIYAIGITNQRETTILWDKKTGEALYNAIVWQCKRTSKYCRELEEVDLKDKIREKTGLIIDPYFSATKIKWILDNVEGARERAEKGEILFGTVDSYLIYKLTDGKIHITDYSNASRTMLFNINNLEWDKELLEIFQIPEKILPEVKNSGEIYGKSSSKFLGGQIPIGSAIGDQQSSLFGQACFKSAMAKATYGTGAFVLMNTGYKAVQSKHGLVTTIAWGLDNKISYALEGSIFECGSAINWLKDNLKILDAADDSEYMATKVKDTCGCYVIPAFSGLGAPYWDSSARGTIVGLTRAVTKNHIIRATLESLCYLSKDVISAMEEDAGFKLKELKVDGGVSANNFILSFLSDLIDSKVLRPEILETTALGAGLMAGLASGAYKNLEELSEILRIEKIFEPEIDDIKREEILKKWHRACKYSLAFAEE